MLPASRRPRRLPSVMSASETRRSRPRTSPTTGNADTICSTADEVETADGQVVVDEQGRRPRRGEAIRPKFAFDTEYEPPPFG